MPFVFNFPLFCIVGSLMCSVISSVLSGRAARILSLCLSGIVCILSFLVLSRSRLLSEPFLYIMGHYSHPWGNEIRMSILEPLFSGLFSLILFLCLLGSSKSLEEDLAESKRSLYYVMVDLIQAALLVLVYTNDLFTGYVFIEICTLASCGILMIRRIGRTTLASVRYMIFSLIGSGLFLLGVILLYNITGHLLMPDLRSSIALLAENGRYSIVLNTAICLITIGLAIKSGLFPFHYWMPDTYGYATPASSGILSGLVSKGYIIFLIKIIFNTIGSDVFYASGVQNVLFIFGMGAMIIGSVNAIRENDLFRMLAYSSAAQIGYVYLGIGLSPQYGVLAALYQILAHAITKPALFLSSSRLCDAAGGSKRFTRLQGAGYIFPLAGAVFSIQAFSMIGIPLTMGFMTKYLLGEAAVHSLHKLVLTFVSLALSTILNTIYFSRTIIRLYTPGSDRTVRSDLRSRPGFLFSTVCFCLINLTAGIFASPLISLLRQGLELFGKAV